MKLTACRRHGEGPYFWEHLDYLVTLVLYLGYTPSWYARSPEALADELGLKPAQVVATLEAFPSLFRKRGEFFSLQLRYANWPHLDRLPDRNDRLEPVSSERMQVLLDYLVKRAESELETSRTMRGNRIAVGSAIVAAVSAIVSAVLPRLL